MSMMRVPRYMHGCIIKTGLVYMYSCRSTLRQSANTTQKHITCMTILWNAALSLNQLKQIPSKFKQYLRFTYYLLTVHYWRSGRPKHVFCRGRDTFRHTPFFFLKYDVTRVLFDNTRYVGNPSMSDSCYLCYRSLPWYISVRFDEINTQFYAITRSYLVDNYLVTITW